MGYGNFTVPMATVTAKYVQNRTVYDLGAGDMELARRLKILGAKEVIGIDKEYTRTADVLPENVRFVHARLQDVPLPKVRPEVVVVSWPANTRIAGLIDWVWRAQYVIYLGCNLDGTACGTPPLYEAFLGRKLLEHVPDRSNTLLVLGEPLEHPRSPTLEEQAGMDPSRVYHWTGGKW